MSMDLTRWAYSVQDERVNATAKAVLVNICFHANYESGKCELKFSTIMGECGLSKSAVTKAVKRLDDAGYLNRERLSYYDSKLRCYSFTVNREVVPRTTSTESVEVVPATNRGRTSSNSRSYQVRHKNPKDEPKAEPTTYVIGSSYVADKKTCTSTAGVGGAVEVKKQLLDNHPSQGTNHEQDPQPSVAELETPKPRDETELNGSGKEGVARAPRQALPLAVQAARDKYPARNVGELLVQWRRHEDEAGLLTYCKLRAGVGCHRVLKPHEAEAEAFPRAEVVASMTPAAAFCLCFRPAEGWPWAFGGPVIDCAGCPSRVHPDHAKLVDGRPLCHWCWRESAEARKP